MKRDPAHRRPGLLRLRPGLPAHLPAHGGPTLTEDDRGLPDQPGMLPRTTWPTTEHVDRAHVSFDHFDRQHLKGWLAWMSRRSSTTRPGPSRCG